MEQTTMERRIPLERTADPDPFYSESNIRYLVKKMAGYKAGRLKLSEHDLPEGCIEAYADDPMGC